MRVAATLLAYGGHRGPTGMQHKFELKKGDATEKSKILHNISMYLRRPIHKDQALAAPNS